MISFTPYSVQLLVTGVISKQSTAYENQLCKHKSHKILRIQYQARKLCRFWTWKANHAIWPTYVG